MKEFLKSFASFDKKAPLRIDLAGETYPNPTYTIIRPNSDVAVIEYIISGEGYVVIDDKPNRVSSDMIYFLPQGMNQNYYADSNNPFNKIFLNVNGSMCEHLRLGYGLNSKYIFQGDGLKSLFLRILDIINSDISDTEMQSALQGVFIEIISRLSVAIKENKHSLEALTIKNFLDSNTERIVSTEELAKCIFRSKDYCQKLFLREFKTTPYAYQIEQKMQIAKSLLINSQMSVGEIAQRVGYSDIHYFSNLFQKKCGLRPLTFRKGKR